MGSISGHLISVEENFIPKVLEYPIYAAKQKSWKIIYFQLDLF